LIKQTGPLTTEDGEDLFNLTFVWAIPQDIHLSEPLHRLYILYIYNESESEIQPYGNFGISIESSTINVNTNPAANDMHVQKLGAGSVAGITFISTILLASALLSLLFTSRDMFSRHKRSLSPKRPSERSSQSFKMKTIARKGYRQVAVKSSDGDGIAGRSDDQHGEPARPARAV
jgi:hypothetical protein